MRLGALACVCLLALAAGHVHEAEEDHSAHAVVDADLLRLHGAAGEGRVTLAGGDVTVAWALHANRTVTFAAASSKPS